MQPFVEGDVNYAQAATDQHQEDVIFQKAAGHRDPAQAV
jgi:hypothetical protein